MTATFQLTWSNAGEKARHFSPHRVGLAVLAHARVMAAKPSGSRRPSFIAPDKPTW
jgi:hypothetical protein